MATKYTLFVIGIFEVVSLTTGNSFNSFNINERLQKMSDVLSKVRIKNAAMKETIQTFEERVNFGKAMLQEIRNHILQLEDMKHGSKKRIAALREGRSQEEWNAYHDRSSTNTRQLHTATVGFSAVISQADLTNLHSGQPVIFDKVITNVGDAYNGTTGEFTAPISGLYVFNMDILVEAGENEYLQFLKDGSHVMYNFAHASGALHDETSSRLVVIELKTGNKLWIRTVPNAHHGSGNLHGNDFSTFSGWLLAITE